MKSEGQPKKKRGFFGRIKDIIISSTDSQHKLSMGAAQGVFWGLTPSVGLQSVVLAAMSGLIVTLNRMTNNRFSFLSFNFPLAFVLTWISNPFNAAPLYFLFYWVGALVLPGVEPMEMDQLISFFKPAFEAEGFWNQLKEGFNVFFNLGSSILIPMVIGSLIIAFPSAILTYMIMWKVVGKLSSLRHKNQAQNESLQEA